MAKLPTFDPIEFLLDRKFGTAGSFSGMPVRISAERRASSDPQLAKQIADYKAHLLTLPPEQIEALLVSARAQQQDESAAKAELEERRRFFNQPNAEADFEHWSKAAHWTLDEAIALSFGRAPEKVTWERVKPYVEASPFAFQYQRRRDLAFRAVAWKQLFDPVLPGIFLAWAKRTDVAVPPELEVAVTARGHQVADWKSLYDDLKANFDDQNNKWAALCQEQRQRIAELVEQIEQLRVQSAPAAARPPLEKSLGTRERESLLKLVIGMAVVGYGYDPKASRSEQPTEIASDLATSGVPLDVDTVRKWLKEAAELLPPPQTEQGSRNRIRFPPARIRPPPFPHHLGRPRLP